jgi:DNA-binding NarL/FixJ family response regulator
VSVCNWVELAARRELAAPVLLLAHAEVALRQRDDQRAQTLGEQAGLSLSGDLAARAYLTAARAAHLRNLASTSNALCDQALAKTKNSTLGMETLWVKFSVARELASVDTLDIVAQLEAFEGHDTSRAFRLMAAKSVLLCDAGSIHDAIAQLEAAAALAPNIVDPFARTNLLHFQAYTYLLAAEYDKAIAASDLQISEATMASLEFAIDYALLRKASALIGLRKLRYAQQTIDELQRRSQTASGFVQDNLGFQRVKLAISVRDLKRASALLDSEFSGTERLAFRGELAGYRSLVAASLGDVEKASAELEVEDRCFRFGEAAGLRSIAQAAISIQRSPLSKDHFAQIRRLIQLGQLDAIVTGYRACPALLLGVSEQQELRRPLERLLSRSNDSDVARHVGLTAPRERRPRERLSPRETEVYELLINGRSNHDIARALYISESTTKVHVRHIFEKLGVHSRAEAARMAAFDQIASRSPPQA